MNMDCTHTKKKRAKRQIIFANYVQMVQVLVNGKRTISLCSPYGQVERYGKEKKRGRCFAATSNKFFFNGHVYSIIFDAILVKTFQIFVIVLLLSASYFFLFVSFFSFLFLLLFQSSLYCVCYFANFLSSGHLFFKLY